LCIVDDYHLAIWVFLLKDKNETYECIINFFVMVRTQFGLPIQRVQSDNGTEFTNGPLQSYFLKQGIIHETSCVDTSQQNGMVECKNQHILNAP